MPRPALLLCLALLAGIQASAATVKVLLIGQPPDHGYRSHTYLPDCDLLARWLKQNGAFETTVARGWPTDPHAFDGVALIVLHDKLGGDVFFAPAHAAQAQALIDRGIGLVALHWGTGSAEPAAGDPWLKALGGHFNAQKGGFSRYKVEASTLRVADAAHPISRGWQDFPVRDEWYYDLRFLPAARPMALVKVGEKDYPAAWAYERPDHGRSFGFVGLHFHDNLASEPFRRLIVNGLLWAAQVEVPAEGALVPLGPRDLDLPEEFEKLKPAAKPSEASLHQQRLGQLKSLDDALAHELEHGTPLAQALAQTAGELQKADWLKSSSLTTTASAVYGETKEGLRFRIGLGYDRLPAAR